MGRKRRARIWQTVRVSRSTGKRRRRRGPLVPPSTRSPPQHQPARLPQLNGSGGPVKLADLRAPVPLGGRLSAADRRKIHLAAVQLAARQHGLITTQQALHLGFTPSMIKGRVKGAKWVRLRDGVFAFAGTPQTRHRDILEVCLAAGEQAVVSRFTAGELWGIEELWPRERPELTVPHAVKRHPAGVNRKRSDLLPDEIDVVDGIPVTSPMRTLLDAASKVRERDLETALMSLVRRGLVDPSTLPALIERYRRRRWPGLRKLRRIVARAAFRHFCRSKAEEKVAQALVQAGIPVQTNVGIEYAGVFLGEFDLVLEAYGVVVEVDSRFHDTDEQRRRDDVRTAAVNGTGRHLLRLRWPQLEDPRHIVELIMDKALEPRPPRIAAEEYRDWWGRWCREARAANDDVTIAGRPRRPALRAAA